MNTVQLLDDIELLPPEAQHQVEDFIAFLKMRYVSTGKTKLSEEEFVNLWSDREEMQDSTQWVGNTRKSEWSKNQPEITKGDKNINPRDFFGCWSQQPRDIKEIRKQAWQRSEIKS